MRFENSFLVDAPVEEVWSTLMDIERVAPCMPGAEVLERAGDNAYKVGIKVKLGPISMSYRGQVEIVERNDTSHTAVMRARAKEARGQGTADAHIHMRLLNEPDGSRAVMETDVQLAGKAASMGQGVIADISAKLFDQFASNLAGLLDPQRKNGGEPADSTDSTSPQPAQRALPAGEIVAGVVVDRLGKPRALLVAGLAFGLACLAIGYAVGKTK